MMPEREGEYGYDAPYGPMIFGGVAAVTAVFAWCSWRAGEGPAAFRMAALSAFFLANMVCFLHTTRRGKFIEWERILDCLGLRGDERVLDLGCGRGAVLTAVARRLTTGRATGIDIWNTLDQSGNAKNVTERNARLEGVADRVAVETADMRALPFPDASFDLVVSSLAIHNIRGRAERRRAVVEAYRVLEPGGRMVLADIQGTSAHEETLRALGAVDVARRRLGWRFWWGNPVAATVLLTGSKPLRS
jgi:cyclopropane fatty-acyl-phospholipid synthase-like methyltransferase